MFKKFFIIYFPILLYITVSCTDKYNIPTKPVPLDMITEHSMLVLAHFNDSTNPHQYNLLLLNYSANGEQNLINNWEIKPLLSSSNDSYDKKNLNFYANIFSSENNVIAFRNYHNETISFVNTKGELIKQLPANAYKFYYSSDNQYLIYQTSDVIASKTDENVTITQTVYSDKNVYILNLITNEVVNLPDKDSWIGAREIQGEERLLFIDKNGEFKSVKFDGTDERNEKPEVFSFLWSNNKEYAVGSRRRYDKIILFNKNQNKDYDILSQYLSENVALGWSPNNHFATVLNNPFVGFISPLDGSQSWLNVETMEWSYTIDETHALDISFFNEIGIWNKNGSAFVYKNESKIILIRPNEKKTSIINLRHNLDTSVSWLDAKHFVFVDKQADTPHILVSDGISTYHLPTLQGYEILDAITLPSN